MCIGRGDEKISDEKIRLMIDEIAKVSSGLLQLLMIEGSGRGFFANCLVVWIIFFVCNEKQERRMKSGNLPRYLYSSGEGSNQ